MKKPSTGLEYIYKNFKSKKEATRYYETCFTKGSLSKDEYLSVLNTINNSNDKQYKGKVSFLAVALPCILGTALLTLSTVYFVPKFLDKESSSSTDTGSIEPTKDLVEVFGAELVVKKDGEVQGDLFCFADYNFDFKVKLTNNNNDLFENSISFKLYSISVNQTGEYQGIQYDDFSSNGANEISALSYVTLGSKEAKELNYVVPFQPIATSNVRVVININGDETINKLFKVTL